MQETCIVALISHLYAVSGRQGCFSNRFGLIKILPRWLGKFFGKFCYSSIVFVYEHISLWFSDKITFRETFTCSEKLPWWSNESRYTITTCLLNKGNDPFALFRYCSFHELSCGFKDRDLEPLSKLVLINW